MLLKFHAHCSPSIAYQPTESTIAYRFVERRILLSDQVATEYAGHENTG